MPFVNPRFRPVPTVAPLASQPDAPLPLQTQAVPGATAPVQDPGFDDLAEVTRRLPTPRMRLPKPATPDGQMRMAGVSAAAASPGAAVQGQPGGSHGVRHPFIGKLSMQDWDVNPYRVARDLGVAK